ncbi:MAG: tetratricopeptide repeat protein [Sedimentisphaerales bacterium]|nr:tetratricopeptide repeat protein [Sedimentisphaerales bacterium]
MSRLLEIFGRAIAFDTADLIWHWLNTVRLPGEDTPSDRGEHLRNTIELMSLKKLDAAAEHLRMYLFEYPSCTHGRLAASAICLYQSQLAEAIKELNSIYFRQPNNTMALYALGYCYERLGKEAQAIEFYQDCLKFKSYLQLPAQRLAAIYFKNNQLERTIEQYELLKSEYPDDISTLLILGHLYVATGRYGNAIDTFNTAILIHPDNFYAPNHEVDALIAEGQLHEALEQLEDLLSTEPARADLLIKHADVLRMLGSTTDAISQYEEVLHLCPDFLEATIKLGTQYLLTEQEQLAAQQFNKAVEINDNIVDAYIGLAISQKLAGKDADAVDTLSLAGAIQPNSSLLFAETANLHFKARIGKNPLDDETENSKGMADAVIAAHCQHIQSRPHNPDLHYRLGVLLMNSGRITHAISSFKTALKINPVFTRARSKLAICLYEADQQAEALELLTSGESLDDETLELHYRTALLYCDKVKFASSLMNLERHLENNFSRSDAVVNISIILQNLGLLDRASATWDNLAETANLALDVNNPFSL